MTRWLDDGEARAWRGFLRAHVAVNAALARELAATSDLSYQDYEVLVALTDAGDARLRSFELADALGWEKSRVSHHVARMEGRGLVRRTPCPDDARGSFVEPTASGRRAIAAAAPAHVEAVRRLFVDRLTPAQLDALGDAFEAVLAGL